MPKLNGNRRFSILYQGETNVHKCNPFHTSIHFYNRFPGYLQTSPVTLVGVVEQNGEHYSMRDSLIFPQSLIFPYSSVGKTVTDIREDRFPGMPDQQSQ
jgi:hypothetical protein